MADTHTDSKPRPHQLIGTEVSLYTGKARAYLRYKGIAFEEVLSTREVYQSVILPRTGVRFIPVLITDDDVAIQDTTAIIDALEQRYPTPSIYPETPLQRLVALLFEVYGDEWLVIPAMHYRWNVPENRRFAIAEFGRTSAPNATAEEQLAIGERLSGPFAGALPYLGITPHSAPAIERSYEGFLAEFDAHLAHHPYLLGTRPSIGDFGLVGPLYAHLWRDPASGRLMERLAPRVVDWVKRMQHPAALRDAADGFLPGDHVPPTLMPMLARMFREQVPVLLRTIEALAEWAGKTDDAHIPRTIGKHEFTVEGVTETRVISPYAVWMWQRPHDHVEGLGIEERVQAEVMLSSIPFAMDALRAPIPQRVCRRENLLMREG